MQQQRRSGIILGFIAVGVLACAATKVEMVQAQTTSVGPYYATPSWDQTLPAATRFVILSNFNSQAVLDRNTGLVWERSPDTASLPWNSTRFSCINKKVGNQKGWRLPAIAELASLIDPTVAFPGPTLPPGHPFTNVQSALYWSASTIADTPTDAWGVAFSSGFVGPDEKSDPNFVWCVRGGMSADAY